MQNASNARVTRKININPFVDNFGTINFSIFLTTLVFFALFYFNILVVLNEIYESKELDYFVIGTNVQIVNIKIVRYIVENMANGLNAFNELSYLNNFLPFKIFPNNINFPDCEIKLTWAMYFCLILSFLFAFVHNILYIYQSQAQNILSSCDLKTHYIPLYYLKSFFKRNKNNYFYIKKIKIMIVKNISKEHKEALINLAFNKDFEEWDIKITNEIHFKIYHITKIELVKKEQKEKKQKEVKETKTKLKNEINFSFD